MPADLVGGYFRRVGRGTLSAVGRLGFAARFAGAVFTHAPYAFVRLPLTLREIYFSGVLSLVIILVSGLFVGMVLALQGYEVLSRYGANESLGILVALSLVRELLAALFSTLGVFGAYVVGVRLIGIDAGAFWGNMQAAVDFRQDIVNGIIKSFVFGVAVSLIAVFEGYDANPTAEGVSTATTRTVVESSLAILALDFVLTVFMFRGVG